ncbi:MAG: PEGA domain-containing protein [Myxococcales bacterium]|nr:PEGA domain-containing protein [Myxococcales bacterium]
MHFERIIGLALLVGSVVNSACTPSASREHDGGVIDVGKVRIWTYPKGAKVWVDGNLELVTTPSTLIKKEGTYQLRLQVPGAEALEAEVTIEAGTEKLLRLDLPRPPDSTITVLADVDGATVRINGYKRGETPLEKAITRPGPVDITVIGAGRRAKSIRSQLGIGEHKTFEVRFATTRTVGSEGRGRVTMRLEPPGFVELPDGTLLGEAPLVEKTLDAGVIDIVLVSKDGKLRREVQIDVPVDDIAIYRFRLGAEDEVDP